MLSQIGPLELAIVAVIAILVLGPKRLPAAGRGVGRSMREFRSALARDSEKAGAKSDSKVD